MRLVTAALASLSVLFLAALPAAAQMREAERQLYEAARKEGEVTWYVAHHTAEHA